ncbi:MAG: hypothetical protein WDN10_01640 [bacterium]
MNATGKYFIVPATVAFLMVFILVPAPAQAADSACLPACTGTDTCVNGKCQAAGTVPGGSACKPACTGTDTCVAGVCRPAGTVPGGGGGGSGLTNPLGFSTIPDFLNAVLDLVIQIGGIVIVLMLVYVGFKFVTAQGAEEKIKEAREALLWTVVGALILLGAKAISLGIQATVQALGT